jgi:N-acetylglucosaminyldiphosphoundecaprenol N-acetyl-beta-D-mannosaminyltransferase
MRLSAPPSRLESQTLVEATTTLTGVRTRHLLGVDFALTDYQGSLAWIDSMIAARERGYICCTSVHGLMVSRRDPMMAAALAGATLNLPDGMPVVWALNLLGGGEARLRDRVYGPTLMERACQRAAEAGYRIFLYGGRDESALHELKGALRERNPQLEIAGAWSPPYRELRGDEERQVARRIDAAEAEIVWCGISTPRQEKWLARMRPRVEAPLLISVGAAFDFLSGRAPQAPPWMQRCGLEWLYRMGREPLRLGPRYLRANPAFAAAVAREWLSQRRASKPS